MLMFRFCGVMVYSCAEWFHTQSLGEERISYKPLWSYFLHCGIKGKCPSVCCKDFCMSFVSSSFMLWPSSTQQFGAFLVRAVTIGQTVQMLELHMQIQRVFGLLCWSAFSMAMNWKLTEEITFEFDWCTFIGRWRFTVEWHWDWQWHTGGLQWIIKSLPI